ncbi:MAG: ImuA family protein, partial [Janthinobacterium lividum]
ETGAAPALFAAGVLARRPGPVVWVGRRGEVFAHALLQAGLDPWRVVFVDAGGSGGRGVLQAMEEALGHPDVAGVVCELDGGLDLAASRRLQLAAEGSQVLGLLLRRSRRFDDPALAQPTAATTRWRVGALPSPPALAHAPDVAGLHRPLWRLDLMRCRGGEPASWTVEGCDAQGRLAVAAVLADRAAAPSRFRAAG